LLGFGAPASILQPQARFCSPRLDFAAPGSNLQPQARFWSPRLEFSSPGLISRAQRYPSARSGFCSPRLDFAAPGSNLEPQARFWSSRLEFSSPGLISRAQRYPSARSATPGAPQLDLCAQRYPRRSPGSPRAQRYPRRSPAECMRAALPKSADAGGLAYNVLAPPPWFVGASTLYAPPLPHIKKGRVQGAHARVLSKNPKP